MLTQKRRISYEGFLWRAFENFFFPRIQQDPAARLFFPGRRMAEFPMDPQQSKSLIQVPWDGFGISRLSNEKKGTWLFS